MKGRRERQVHGEVRSIGTEAGAPAAPPTEVVTPSWRGRLHQVAFFVAVPAGIALVAMARGTSARVSATIYAVSLIGMYGTSAAYHRLARSERSRRLLKRVDHSMIYLLIAGTVTPVSLLALRPPWSILLLAAVWTGTLVGIALKLIRIDGFGVLTAGLYIALGWAVVAVSPQLIRGLSAVSLSLVVVGGLLYTAGAIVLLRKRPDPVPATFGYHEVWHSMVVAASACHYAAVLVILLPARAAIG